MPRSVAPLSTLSALLLQAPYLRVLAWLLFLGSPSLAMSNDAAQSAQRLEQEYHQLEQRLEALEQDNSLKEKSLSVAVAVIIDLALELTHTINLMHSSPDYFYQTPITGPSDLRHIWRDIIYRTLETGYQTGIGIGLLTWLSENGGALPALSSQDSLWQLGIISGGMAGIYSLLNARMLHSATTTKDLFTFNNHPNPLLINLQLEAKPWFVAVSSLHTSKRLLQAAAATTMVCWSFLKRFNKQAEIQDLRDSLWLARAGMRRAYQEARADSSIDQDIKKELSSQLDQLFSDTTNKNGASDNNEALPNSPD